MNDMSVNPLWEARSVDRRAEEYFEWVERFLGILQEEVPKTVKTIMEWREVWNQTWGHISEPPVNIEREKSIITWDSPNKQRKKEIGHNKWDCFEIQNGKKVSVGTVEILDEGLDKKFRRLVKVNIHRNGESLRSSEELHGETNINNFLIQNGIRCISYKDIQSWGKKRQRNWKWHK